MTVKRKVLNVFTFSLHVPQYVGMSGGVLARAWCGGQRTPFLLPHGSWGSINNTEMITSTLIKDDKHS